MPALSSVTDVSAMFEVETRSLQSQIHFPPCALWVTTKCWICPVMVVVGC